MSAEQNRQGPYVGVAGVVIDPDGRVAMIQRPDGAADGGAWAFPGGKPHFRERLEAAVVREVHEETGLRVRPVELLWVGDLIGESEAPPWHYVLVNFRCELLSGELRAADDAAAAAWLTASGVRKLNLALEVATVLDMVMPLDD